MLWDISPDGQHLIISTGATNLINERLEPDEKILYNTNTKQYTRISSKRPIEASFSHNGRYIVYRSRFVNSSDKTDIYVYDFQTGESVPIPILPQTLTPLPTGNIHISDDGRYVIFASTDPQLTGQPYLPMVFLRDRQLKRTIPITVAYRFGDTPNDMSVLTSISADGRFITFISSASNLITNDTNNKRDLFVRDWQAGTTTRVSLGDDDVPMEDTHSIYGALDGVISPDGRYVLFSTYSMDLIKSTNPYISVIFLRDLQMKQTILITVGENGTEINDHSQNGYFSHNNQTVVFSSSATNIIPYSGFHKLNIFTTPLSRLYKSFIVNTTDDVNDGNCDETHCSLREAIIASNNTDSQARLIGFNIPGQGLHTIQPTSELPTLVRPVIITGKSQPGYANVPIIEIDGSFAGANANGFTLDGGNSAIRGLLINRFSGAGIEINTQGGNIISENYIGTNSDGSRVYSPMDAGIRINNSPNNIIGSTERNKRNIISGNQNGIVISGVESTNNTIKGNYIGTDIYGTYSLGNLMAGVWIDNAPRNTISSLDRDIVTTTDTPSPNIISGNNTGILISGSNAEANQILGNYIGTDLTGSISVGNTLDGIRIENAPRTIIGKSTYTPYINTISGNGNGIHIIGQNATETTIAGNFIGTNVSSATGLGNQNFGIWLENTNFNLIGDEGTTGGNVISGNNPSQNISGGGIRISGTSNIIKGNWIGTDKTGLINLGNGSVGIWLDGGQSNQIGTGTSNSANIIAFNNGVGILISGALTNNNRVTLNRIYSNTGLGIDLSSASPADGVSINDVGDSDTGPNNFQNFPEISVALTSQTYSFEVRGSLSSTPNQTYKLEFYMNDTCDLSGYGEGQNFIKSITVTTNADGTIAYRQELNAKVLEGKYITATAIDPNGNTSEFSACQLALVPQSGPVFTVNTLGDSGKWCTVASCSLREAIIASNDHPDYNYINFKIPGNAPFSIQPNSPLPIITSPLIVNGATQPGYSNKPIIELNGGVAGANADGLSFTSSNGSVNALIINNFSAHGIYMPNGGYQITGNYIGVDSSGTVAQPNGSGGLNEGGIYSASFITIGGTTTKSINVISGNSPNGIVISSQGTVLGNIIGLDSQETNPIPNVVGINAGDNSHIGGPFANSGNVISGNTTNGIMIQGHGNTIFGNYIGTNRSITLSLGNGAAGIHVTGSQNVIGGWETGQQNVIAFNLGAGIQLGNENQQANQNSLTINTIHSNIGLGIDLFPLGVTLNDPNDVDSGTNNLQNFPVLTAIEANANQLHITGELNSIANNQYRLDFFANSGCDISSYGEGQYWIGTTTVVTNEQGFATFDANFGFDIANVPQITAIATDLATKESSEFSHCRTVETVPNQNEAPQLHYYTTPTVLLSWGDVSGATGYEIQIASSDDFNNENIIIDAQLNTNNLEFVWNPLVEGEFFWRVGIKTTNGSILWSQVESFIVDIP